MSSFSAERGARRLTLGVLGNRQIYSGATIARYEQILLRGIRAAARAHGCNLLLACGVGADTSPFQRRPAGPFALPGSDFVPVGPWNTAGLLAIPPFTDEQQCALHALPPDYPIVFTSHDERYPSVGPDNDAGIAQALAHLVGHGHRQIVFLAADTSSDGTERLAAFHAAAQTLGLPSDSPLVAFGGHSRQISQRALADLIHKGIEFTAVLASNDESAIGALWALTDAGRRVPAEVALIGFDDVLYAKAQAPPLTTVRHPTFEIGYRAVELLLDRIAGRRVEASVRVPTRLVIRESCGCQP